MEVRDATRAVYRVKPEAARADDVPSGYKRTEVGVIPDDWRVIPLGSLARGIFRGASPRPIDDPIWFDERSGIGWVRISDVTNANRYLTETTQQLSQRGVQSSRYLPAGALIMSICATVGRPIETRIDVCIHDGFVVFDRPKADQGFLYHVLAELEPRWSAKGQTGSQMNLNTGLIKGTEVPVPPTEAEQQAIAEALSDADALIESLQQLIAKQRALKQGAMQALLTGRQRLPGFTGEWSRAELRKMVSTPITDGPHMTPAFQESGVPFLSVNNLVNNRIDLTDLRYISAQDDETFARKCKPRRGDVLVGKAASVGKVALVENDFNFNIWSPIALVRLSPVALPRFVYYQLLGADCSSQIALLTNSSSQGNIGMGDIETIQVSYPPLDEQTAIATVLSDMDAEIEALEARLAKTRALKAGMMQQLLTGRIRLPLARVA